MRPDTTFRILGECSGFYTVERIKPGVGVIEKAAFPNLITDAGLLRMGGNSDYLNYCYVGSGNTPAQFTDTQLEALVGRVGGTTGTGTGAAQSPPYYGYATKVWTSGVGEVAGNLSEIGVGWAPNGLFSRALIVDQDGEPTTIAVLPDEQLRVTYEHRYYAPAEDVVGTFELTGNLGGEYNFIGRAARVTYSQASFGRGWNASLAQTNRASSSPDGQRIYNGPIGPVTGTPSGSSGSVSPASGVQSGLSAAFTYSFGLSEGNLSGGIRSIMIPMGNGQYQFEFDPPIPKTSEDLLTLVFSHEWGRRDD